MSTHRIEVQPNPASNTVTNYGALLDLVTYHWAVNPSAFRDDCRDENMLFTWNEEYEPVLIDRARQKPHLGSRNPATEQQIVKEAFAAILSLFPECFHEPRRLDSRAVIEVSDGCPTCEPERSRVHP